MKDPELLKTLVDQYRLDIDGVEFWVPYFINTPKAFGPVKTVNLKGPYLGKGTPSQLRAALKRYIEAESFSGRTPEEYRKFMHRHRLGVECSGFIYYVLDSFLRRKGFGSLQRYLYWSRQELLEAFDEGVPWHNPDLPRLVVTGYPDWVSLGHVKADWGWKTPRKLVNVKRLVHEQACEVFDNVSKLRAGDMIYMTGHDRIAHAVLVLSVDGKTVKYVHAAGTHGRPNYYGGVEFGEIKVIDSKLPIDKQGWSDRSLISSHSFGQGALRRLKALKDG